MTRVLPVLMLGILLLEIAWGVAWCIPSAEERRVQALAGRVTANSPAAEICAEVDLAFRVRLTAEDVQTLKMLSLQGLPFEEALQTVITYRRAAGN